MNTELTRRRGGAENVKTATTKESQPRAAVPQNKKKGKGKAPKAITAEELREIIPGAIYYHKHGKTPCPRCLATGLPLREHDVGVVQTMPNGVRRMTCRRCRGEILCGKRLPAVGSLMAENGYTFKAVESRQEYEDYMREQERARLETLRADLQTAETVMKHKHIARERAFKEYAEARRAYRNAERALREVKTEN